MKGKSNRTNREIKKKAHGRISYEVAEYLATTMPIVNVYWRSSERMEVQIKKEFVSLIGGKKQGQKLSEKIHQAICNSLSNDN